MTFFERNPSVYNWLFEKVTIEMKIYRLLFSVVQYFQGVAAAYARKSGKQAGKFSRKIRNLYKNQEL
jgi:hypothetical protein